MLCQDCTTRRETMDIPECKKYRRLLAPRLEDSVGRRGGKVGVLGLC